MHQVSITPVRPTGGYRLRQRRRYRPAPLDIVLARQGKDFVLLKPPVLWLPNHWEAACPLLSRQHHPETADSITEPAVYRFSATPWRDAHHFLLRLAYFLRRRIANAAKASKLSVAVVGSGTACVWVMLTVPASPSYRITSPVFPARLLKYSEACTS